MFLNLDIPIRLSYFFAMLINPLLSEKGPLEQILSAFFSPQRSVGPLVSFFISQGTVSYFPPMILIIAIYPTWSSPRIWKTMPGSTSCSGIGTKPQSLFPGRNLPIWPSYNKEWYVVGCFLLNSPQPRVSPIFLTYFKSHFFIFASLSASLVEGLVARCQIFGVGRKVFPIKFCTHPPIWFWSRRRTPRGVHKFQAFLSRCQRPLGSVTPKAPSPRLHLSNLSVRRHCRGSALVPCDSLVAGSFHRLLYWSLPPDPCDPDFFWLLRWHIGWLDFNHSNRYFVFLLLTFYSHMGRTFSARSHWKGGYRMEGGGAGPWIQQKPNYFSSPSHFRPTPLVIPPPFLKPTFISESYIRNSYNCLAWD